MNECVVRMEMPKDCLHCPMVHFDSIGNLQGCEAKSGKRYLQGKEDEFWDLDRPSWCPIICQLPEGHGRLVDADDLLSNRYIMAGRDTVGVKTHIRLSDIDNAPTIVPAETERSD